MKRRKLLLQQEEIDLKNGFQKEATVAVTLGRKEEDDNEIRVFFRDHYIHWAAGLFVYECVWPI